MTRRAAIYARYSSDLQRDASIDDQLRVCRQLIAREGWNEGEVYTDAAISGATLLRPEYQRMLEDARAGRFDVIVAEGLDRISRDQEHIAAFYKQTSFCGIPVITRAEGEISELHIGLKGTMAALFLKDLAQKTHRGLEGRINEGKSAGGKAYGYRVVKGTDAQGDTLTGELEPVPEEVAVVRRIFKDYATGLSARSIAAALNRDGVPAPGGAEWSFSTISGNWKRGTGILNNELYIGRRLWNRQRFMKDPITGKRQARMNPESEWKVADVPVLRIIEDELWGAVKTRQGALRSVLLSPEGRPRPEQARRPKYLFSGLMKCSCCGARYTLINASTYSCSATRNKGTCANRATIKRNEIERRILEGLKSRLMHPELLAEFVSAYHAEWNLLAAVSS